jgi:hypothetical protein
LSTLLFIPLLFLLQILIHSYYNVSIL